ncbi:MAG: preprotein translocase subunit YajC [Clostridia bacterium]|nr:preprotein translocase subunit YajC [Clostridia bacterium]MDD4047228.1 preprotein translocase subunit YajC [Clostridia bacterium]
MQTVNYVYLIAIFAFMYFLMIRPQQKQRKKRLEMLDGLKMRDKVVTIGGIFGEIVAIDEESIQLEISQDVCIKMQRSSVGLIQTDEDESFEEEKEEEI